MNLASHLLPLLEKMGITEPAPVQCSTIPVAMSGADLISVAQTGSGKTLAYVLPILTNLVERPTARALVLAPSRETAQQIYQVFESLIGDLKITRGIVIAGLDGGKLTTQMNRNPRLIVATPGRLCELLTKNKLLLQKVEMLVIDEADRMLDKGFSPQLKTIKSTMRGAWQTMMFSASFSSAVESMARGLMRDEAFMIRASRAESPVASLTQTVYFIERRKKNARLLKEVNSHPGGILIFTDSEESCVTVGEFLVSVGHPSDLIHGGLLQGHRDRVVRDFRSGAFRILVTTDLLARGLDFPHVEHIVNYDLPFKAEDFLHRIGRTARAGRAGTATTFVTQADGRTYRKIKTYLREAEEVLADPDFKFTEDKDSQEAED